VSDYLGEAAPSRGPDLLARALYLLQMEHLYDEATVGSFRRRESMSSEFCAVREYFNFSLNIPPAGDEKLNYVIGSGHH